MEWKRLIWLLCLSFLSAEAMEQKSNEENKKTEKEVSSDPLEKMRISFLVNQALQNDQNKNENDTLLKIGATLDQKITSDSEWQSGNHKEDYPFAVGTFNVNYPYACSYCFNNFSTGPLRNKHMESCSEKFSKNKN